MVDLSQTIYTSPHYQPFDVTRRAETVGTNGRNTLTTTPFPGVYGCVWPEGAKAINRLPDGSLPGKVICIVTEFALRDDTTGAQPDIVTWGNDQYTVNRIEDWSHVGPGFIKATCFLYQTTATAPVTPDAL